MSRVWHDVEMAESYASQFARKGGQARARKLTPEQRSESARKAVEARWAKQKKLVEEITKGTKALLKQSRANARAAKARRAKQEKPRPS
jgi:hypothetical protein